MMTDTRKVDVEKQRRREQAIAIVARSLGKSRAGFSAQDWALVSAHEKRAEKVAAQVKPGAKFKIDVTGRSI